MDFKQALNELQSIREDLTRIYTSFPVSMQKALDLRADSTLIEEIKQIKIDVKLGADE